METITKQNIVTEKFLKLIESSFPTIVDGKEKDLAIKAFVNQGVPTRKHEEYKYVNVYGKRSKKWCVVVHNGT